MEDSLTTTPKVSIVIVSWEHPHIINVCLNTLTITEGVDYEVVVVDNGSNSAVQADLMIHKKEGRIDTLVLESKNHFYSGGNNIGVAHTNPNSEYILLLNSDVAFLKPDWLVKQLQWINGEMIATPNVWCTSPTYPKPGKLDFVSIGWSHDSKIMPGHARPEGWCLLMRREWWKDLDTDLPFHGGAEQMVASAVREGARCGVLFNYPTYLIHKEGGSGKTHPDAVTSRPVEEPVWYDSLNIETLDFTLDCPNCPGLGEHSTYMDW